MNKVKYRYDQTAARILIEGYPDSSQGDSEGIIGIITLWKLSLVGCPELEGSRDHLQALMKVILTYGRNCLSDLRKEISDDKQFITISPLEVNHKIILKSSKEGVSPVTIIIDDAILSDLVRCLDNVLCDTNINISWHIPQEKSLSKMDIYEKRPIIERIGSFIVALTTFSLVSFLILLLPLPQSNELNPEENESLSKIQQI